MSKIDLDPITSGYNLSKINANFQKVEDELNSKVLYRNPPTGEPNSMSSNLDMNSQSILNASKISSNVLELGGVQVVPTNLAVDPYNGTREALRRSYAEAGYNLVDGSFEAGGTITTATDVLLYESNGKAYSWSGTLPKTISAGSTPVGDASWVLRADALLKTSVTALSAEIDVMADRLPIKGQHSFIEQFISGFFGRGMLTAETINITTEQVVSASSAPGSKTITVPSTAQLVIGGCITVKHDNGKYGTYFISAKTSNVITIEPALRYQCSKAVARVERTWYNRAHPGKFYIRELAQRIAHSTELDAAAPHGKRVLFSNYTSQTLTEDTLVGTPGPINYYNASNTGISADTDSPVRFTFKKSAHTAGTANATFSAETPLFNTNQVNDAVIKLVISARQITAVQVTIENELGFVLLQETIPADKISEVLRIFTLKASLRKSKAVKVKITATAGASGGYITINQIDVFESNIGYGKIITNKNATVVVFGDSWVAGDLASTPEREPMTTQLALELPDATIINAGVGGNTITNLLARFDTDVAPYMPDYVVVNTGTNDAYNPASGTFDPNSLDYFVNAYSRLLAKINDIGARAIVIGVPALAQSDSQTAFPEWTLNDRARLYAKAIFDWQATPARIISGGNANGTFERFPGTGLMICRTTVSVTTTAANTVAATVWTFPAAFLSIPSVIPSLTAIPSAQMFCLGANTTNGVTSSIQMITGTGGVTATVSCVAIGYYK